MERSGEEQVSIKQEPKYKIWSRKFIDDSLKNLIISNVCQLIVIWIMMLLQFVAACNFSAEEYISNLLSFDVVACATNLAGAYGKGKRKEKGNTKRRRVLSYNLAGILIIGISFTSVLYSLLLINSSGADIPIRIDVIWALTIIITLIVILISLWQAVRR